MPAVHLGKLDLHWCHRCNVPVLGKGECGICSGSTEGVKVTPPGDVRPAFDFDLRLLRDTVDGQWGHGYSQHVIPENKIVLLNSCPGLDRMDEVIVDGEVIGTLQYDMGRRIRGERPYKFIIRPWKGLPMPERGFVVMDRGAVEPIMKGASALAVGILEGDNDIKKGDEVLVLDPEGKVLCSGSAQRDGEDMISAGSGKGVKSRWRVSDRIPLAPGQGRDGLLVANEKVMKEMVEKAVNFIRSKVREYSLTPVVSYSGGKDSLATLLLVLEAGVEPDMIFVNTGIELPETVDNVEQTAERYGLNLKTISAEDGYWKAVEYFGPSARDYRWCCKTCKLGPVAKLIGREYPEGVLAFIGQRRYESENRMLHGDTWNNPWVPGQTGTSPIQDWTALHVWLLLFSRDALYNPWYERGFQRIGCWVCPASDLSELESLRDSFQGYGRFQSVLDEYTKKMGLPQQWKDWGLWRWVHPPEELFRMLELDRVEHTAFELPPVEDMLKDRNTLGLLECVFGLRPGDNISGKRVADMYLRAHKCVGCHVCAERCPQGAISLDGGLKIDGERCVGCGECTDKCTVVEFRARVIL